MKYKKPTIMGRLAGMHWKTNRIWEDTVRYAVHAYRMSSNSCLYISFASTSYSWSHNITIGRSSDLDIIILIRLPGDMPVTLRILNVSVQDYGIKTPSLQRRVRAGLAPASLFTKSSDCLFDTYHVLFTCEHIIAYSMFACKNVNLNWSTNLIIEI